MNSNIVEAGFSVETYVGSLRNYRSFVRTLMGEAHANAEHVTALAAAVANAPQPVKATLMTEDWCGDAACNLPILASLLGGAGIELSVVRGSEQPAINDYYNKQGVDHIPVLSIWDGEFNELVRWIEAPAAVTVKKDAWKAELPEFMELYRKQKEDKEAAKKFAGLYRGFMDEMKEWYKAGMWDETTREIVQAAQG
jgi:Thioredoxin